MPPSDYVVHGGRDCCSFPNGCFAIFPASLSIISTILSTVAWSSCHFARVKVLEQSSLNYDIGMFSRETTLIDLNLNYDEDYLSYVFIKGCAQYTALEREVGLDTYFEAARAFGVLAGIMGFFLMSVTWIVAPCIAAPKLVWRFIGGFFMLNGIFQLMTLLILSSKSCETCLIGMWGGAQIDFKCDANCKLAPGGEISVVAAVLWFLSGALCFCIDDVDYSSKSRQPARTPLAFATRAEVEIPAVASAVASDSVEADSPVVSAVASEPTTTTERVGSDGDILIEKVVERDDGGAVKATNNDENDEIPEATATGELPVTRGEVA